MYVEVAGGFGGGQAGSIQSGIAITNASTATTPVNFELTNLDGSPTGLAGATSIPGSGQLATFLNQIRGFESLPQNFRGILRISTPSPFAPGISVVGLRGRYNERGDFLISTTSPLNESEASSVVELVFPHFVDGGGYTTQFILHGPSANQYSGTLSHFMQAGQPFSLRLSSAP